MPTVSPYDMPRRKNQKPLPLPKLDRKQAIILKTQNGLSYEQIGALQGISKQAVHEAIHKDIKAFIADQEVTKSYKEHRADILAGLQVKTLTNLDDTRLKAASALQLVTATGILYDKERLERGQTSANIGVAVGLSSELQDALDKLVQRIA